MVPDEQRDHLIDPLPPVRFLSGTHRIQALRGLSEDKNNFMLNWCASLVERGLFPDGIKIDFTQIHADIDDEFSDLPELVTVNDDEFSDLPDLV